MAESYTLTDYRIDLYGLRKLGIESQIAGLYTGVYDDLPIEDWPAMVECLERLLDAMTVEERRNPGRIDSSEMQRLAATTGTPAEEVARAIEHFKRVPNTMRRLAELSMWERIKVVCGLVSFPRTP